MTLRMGTRGSALARAQSSQVAAWLERAGHRVETEVIQTAGDRDRTSAFAAIGPPGIFVREIEQALLDQRIDVAVHSYKDLPSTSPEGLTIAAVPDRQDVADLLLMPESERSPEASDPTIPLAAGARLATSSARRIALLREVRPDLEIRPIRGNVPTRLNQVAEGHADGLLLAAAGVTRLRTLGQGLPLLDYGWIECRLDPARFVPAPAQGALAVQVRADDSAARAAVAELDVASIRAAVDCEREVLKRVEGGCQTALGVWCRAEDEGGFRVDAALEVAGVLRRSGRTGRSLEALAAQVAGELLHEVAR